MCEQRISRGRRFFLMGALVVPVAAKIARVAAIVQPVYEAPKLLRLGRIVVRDRTGDTLWTFDDLKKPGVWHEIDVAFKLAVAT